MKKFLIAVITAFSFIFSGTANADYPNGPVQFLIPWPPGDFEDILTRMIADEWKNETGMPASVVNRPGGGDGPFPGALEVLDAPADGSVIGSFVIGVPLVGPLIDIGIDAISWSVFICLKSKPFNSYLREISFILCVLTIVPSIPLVPIPNWFGWILL